MDGKLVIPKSIKDKIARQNELLLKAEDISVDVEEWYRLKLEAHGIETEEEANEVGDLYDGSGRVLFLSLKSIEESFALVTKRDKTKKKAVKRRNN